MFERLQKERESEEQKLEAARVTLRQQQEQLEKELTEQRTKLEQLLTAVTAAEGRLRTLQEEERCSESLEMTLSQASEYTAGLGVAGWLAGGRFCLSWEVCEEDPGPGQSPRRRKENRSGKEGSSPGRDG